MKDERALLDQRMHGYEDAAWDPATLDLDADVAAIARWAAAHDAHTHEPTTRSEAPGPAAEDDREEQGEDEEEVVVEEEEEECLRSGRTDTASDSSAPRDRSEPKRRKRSDAPRTRRIRKPRKSTYVAQKELKSSLNDEIRVLEARLELLRVRAGLPSSEDKRSVASVQAANFEIEEAIHANLLDIARFHSMISRHMHSIPGGGPMSTSILLSKDAAERRATLRAIRDMKLRRAREVLENRMQYVDNTKPYVVEERFFSDDGVFHCKRFEVLPFDAVGDVSQAFDALLGFLANMAPTLTRRARGRAVVREDFDLVDQTTWLRRVVAEFRVGSDAPSQSYTQELHCVGFAQLFPSSDKKDPQPVGIVAVDSIDGDELYPYKPLERVRKDVTAAISVRLEPASKGPHRHMVVVRKSTFLRLHDAPFPLAPAVKEDMRARMTDWCVAMNAALRDALPGALSS